MQNENEKMQNGAEQTIRTWQFWFLVSFSVFLVVTFVFYLPLRFQYNVLLGEGHGEMMQGEMEGMHRDMDMMRGDEHGGTPLFHEEWEVEKGLRVYLTARPTPSWVDDPFLWVDVPMSLEFFVGRLPGNIPVPFSELELNHEKLMHVIGVRSDLNEFFHIHPDPTADEYIFLTDEYIFSKPGRYKLWSEVKKDGVVHVFGHNFLEVHGEGKEEEKKVSLGRNAIVGNYQVSLDTQEPISKGHEHDLSFDIRTLTGREVQVQEYLGAAMHLAIIKDDLSQFFHTHPEGNQGEDHHGFLELFPEAKAHGEEEGARTEKGVGADETIDFHVVFPEAGLYKAFAQFRPKGIDLPEDEALTASFWLQVQEKPEVNARTVWVLLLIASLAAILILSIGVHKFITVKK